MNLSLQAFDDVFAHISKHLPKNDNQPDTLINLRLLHALSQTATNYYNLILSQYDLNETDYLALIILYANRETPLQPSQLSDILGLTRTGATRLGDKLVKLGYLTRKLNRTDRRSVKLFLTKSGQEIIERITPELSIARFNMWQDLDTDEVKIMQRAMRKLIQRLQTEVEHIIKK